MTTLNTTIALLIGLALGSTAFVVASRLALALGPGRRLIVALLVGGIATIATLAVGLGYSGTILVAPPVTQPATPTTTEPTLTLPKNSVTPWQDVRVRRAIAQCIDRRDLALSVYPDVSSGQSDAQVMDALLPAASLGNSQPVPPEPFDPSRGRSLLTEAGWLLPDGARYRVNADGEELSFAFRSPTDEYRNLWPIVEDQLANCGIQIVRSYVPRDWWFGETTGLKRRDFAVAVWTWVGQAPSGLASWFSCQSIPSADNGWQGMNYMGWCNLTASHAAEQADNPQLSAEERQRFIAILQEEIAKDLPVLPLIVVDNGSEWLQIAFNLGN